LARLHLDLGLKRVQIRINSPSKGILGSDLGDNIVLESKTIWCVSENCHWNQAISLLNNCLTSSITVKNFRCECCEIFLPHKNLVFNNLITVIIRILPLYLNKVVLNNCFYWKHLIRLSSSLNCDFITEFSPSVNILSSISELVLLSTCE
jgi:hypothetical protein